MRIALCFFGSVGSLFKPTQKVKNFIDPLICHESINKNLLNNNNIDVFIHTWSTKYNNKLLKLYKPKKYLIEKPKNFTLSIKDFSLKDIDLYDNIEQLKKEHVDPISSYNDLIYRMQSRWYSQSQSLKILEQFKKSKKITYDFVVQMRLDLILNKEINFKKLNNNIVHLVKGQKHNKKKLYDTFFVTNYSNGIKFNSIIDNLTKYPVDPNNLIYKFLKKNNLNYKNTFNFNDIILHRYYQNIDISFIKFLYNKTLVAIYKIFDLLEKIIVFAKKILNKKINPE